MYSTFQKTSKESPNWRLPSLLLAAAGAFAVGFASVHVVAPTSVKLTSLWNPVSQYTGNGGFKFDKFRADMLQRQANCYANRHPALKAAFCGSGTCQAQALYNHWEQLDSPRAGVRVGRLWGCVTHAQLAREAAQKQADADCYVDKYPALRPAFCNPQCDANRVAAHWENLDVPLNLGRTWGCPYGTPGVRPGPRLPPPPPPAAFDPSQMGISKHALKHSPGLKALFAAADKDEDAPRVPLVAIGVVATAALALVALSRRKATPAKPLTESLVKETSPVEDCAVLA